VSVSQREFRISCCYHMVECARVMPLISRSMAGRAVIAAITPLQSFSRHVEGWGLPTKDQLLQRQRHSADLTETHLPGSKATAGPFYASPGMS
jgi:hypothetical protein